MTKHFCEKCNYFHLRKRCNSCENKTTIPEPKPVPYYCEKCNKFSSEKECFMCKNELMKPEDFDSETLTESSAKSSQSVQTYYESDAKDFIERDKYKYIQNQNGTVLNNQLYFSDNELMMDDSSDSSVPCNFF